MTTEKNLTEEFFKTFGIEKSSNNCPMQDKNNCVFVPSECNYYQFPEITDRILLELICCVPKTVLNNCTTIKEIKEAVLKDLILCMRKYTAQELKQQIQKLFKEKNNEL